MNPNYPTLLSMLLCSSSGLLYCPSTLLAQSPGGVSTNLSLWVKAASALPVTAGTLTKWTDATGTNTFTLSGTGMTTVLNTVNFNPIVRFTGSGKLIGNTSINWSEASAVVSWTGATTIERGTVISPTTSGTQVSDASRYYFRSGVESNPGNFLFSGMGVDSIGFEYIASPPTTQVNVLTASGANNVFNRNGLNATVGSLFGGFTARATVMSGIPQIGDRSTDDAKMIGDIAEIIVYSADNSANRNKVESYLALKYGITLGSGGSPINYTSSNGTVFWTGNATYQHNIFGIGADAGSALTQTTSNSMNSGSGNGVGQSGLGNLVLTATGTPSSQQFLMIGTDSASLGEETITTAMGSATAVGSKRLIRTWKVQNTNATTAAKMSFDMTGLTLSGGTTAANYWLMVDNDGDGNFNTGAQAFSRASSITGNLVNFTTPPLGNLTVFTIITKPTSMVVLATTLESFTAVASQNTATLKWTVAGDNDIDDYAIERSSDGTNFTQTGNVPATSGSGTPTSGSVSTAGASGSYQYQETLSPGIYYYRIRMIDRDGNTQFSGVRSIQIAGQSNVRLGYNPIHGNELELLIDLPSPAAVQYSVVDTRGRLIGRQSVSLPAGGSQLTIPLPGLAAGLYYVQVQTPGFSSTRPFLK
jgi:hypothetical protein